MNTKIQKELLTIGERSLVQEIRIDGYKRETTKYIVCSNFDSSKPINWKWTWGHYFDVWAYKSEDECKKAALNYFMDRGDITYHRMEELATRFKDYIVENLDDDDYYDFFTKDCEMNKEEMEFFGMKMRSLFKSYKVTVTRQQTFETTVILPEDSTEQDAIDEIDDCDIDWNYDCSVEIEDSEYNAEVDESDMDSDYVKRHYDEDDVFNWDDIEF